MCSIFTALSLPLYCDDARGQISELCLQQQLGNQLLTPTIKVLSLNISHGRKTAMNQLLVRKKRHMENLDLIATLLRESGADVAALQEADGPSRWSGGFDHVRYLLEKSGLNCFVHSPHADNWMYSYGTAILQRVRPVNTSAHTFRPSPPTTDKGFVTTELSWQVEEREVSITIVSVHLDFSRKKVRDAQISEMIESLSGIDTPLIVMGDFNSEWLAERSHVRALAEGLKLTAWDPESTVLGSYKSTAGKRFDWILISSQLEFRSYDVLPDIVSDHQAVYAEIAYLGEQ